MESAICDDDLDNGTVLYPASKEDVPFFAQRCVCVIKGRKK